MASQENDVSSLLSHYSFLLMWRAFRAVSVAWAWRFFKWGVRNEFLLKDYRPPKALHTALWGCDMRTPIGIGSEVDISGSFLDALVNLGYGFGEFGTYTLAKEDPLNRIVFDVKDNAVCAEMHGYKNKGVDAIVPMLSDRRYLPHLTGVSIASTARNEANNLKQGSVMSYPAEFETMTQKVAPYCDYIVANFTLPGAELTELIYDEATILPVLKKIKEAAQIAAPLATPKVVVKLPSDLTEIEIPIVARICERAGVDGIIIGGPLNLTKRRIFIKEKLPPYAFNALMGKPLKKQVQNLIRSMYKETEGKIPIIARGAVFSGQDVYDYIAAGASLVQVHAVLFFEGPFAFKKIHQELFRLMRRNGINSIEELIGSGKEKE